MAFAGGRALKRRTSPSRGQTAAAAEGRRPDEMRVRHESERRSKVQQDRPSPSTVKGKGKMRQHTPPSRKRKVVDVEDSSSSEEDGTNEDPNWR